jgi:hypothetical protein
MSYDHERRRDRNDFALEPLFQRLSNQEDMETGLKFGMYVLKWHADRKYYGHVLKYGKHCPTELSQLMSTDESLKPYQWIISVRNKDYNVATDELVSISKLPMMSFKEVSNSICIASIASTIIEEEALSPSIREVANRRRRVIDKKLELIHIQKQLMIEDTSPSSHDFTQLWSAERLIDLTIQKAQQHCTDVTDKVAMLIHGLAACVALDSISEMRDNAIVVWVNVIRMDLNFWKVHVTGQSDATLQSLTRPVLDTTVFGGLLQELDGITDWKVVSYVAVEDAVMERLFHIDPELVNLGLRRLLSTTSRSLNNNVIDMME